jgi:hypothetical protein
VVGRVEPVEPVLDGGEAVRDERLDDRECGPALGVEALSVESGKVVKSASMHRLAVGETFGAKIREEVVEAFVADLRRDQRLEGEEPIPVSISKGASSGLLGECHGGPPCVVWPELELVPGGTAALFRSPQRGARSGGS